MDFAWTEEQEAYRDVVVKFASALPDDVRSRDGDGEFAWDAWKRCAAFGIQGLNVPEEYGGADADALTTIVAMEALGYGSRDNGLLFSINAQMWACQHPIVQFGTEEQKRKYLPRLCDGSSIAAHGMSEPGSGSDAFALATTAVLDGDHYILNGSKIFVTNAPVADLFVVFATTNPGKGFAGLCGFLVERDTPGFTVGRPLEKMGLRTSPMAELFFDDARVPVANLIGKPRGGMAIFNAAMERERSLILACTIGTMERLVEDSLAYAKQRRQFGQRIGKFQAVSHRIVEMKLRLETARLLLYRLGWLIDQGRPIGLDAALTKLYVSECFVQSGLDAVHVFGGYGYMQEYDVERVVRDALGSRLYSGTSDIQRNLAAMRLGL
ncbi:MAG TPA: acyl-CoA dehydrogenase family protein [Acidimicrobiia bacterium]|nr:acyl-CoA dehydrogenase family protein [Acidimicrobiia bacterium]